MAPSISCCLLRFLPGGQVMAEEDIWVYGDAKTPSCPALFVTPPPPMDDPGGQSNSRWTEKALGCLEQQPCDGLSTLLGPLALRIPREAAPPAGWSRHPLHHSPNPETVGCWLIIEFIYCLWGCWSCCRVSGSECFKKNVAPQEYTNDSTIPLLDIYSPQIPTGVHQGTRMRILYAGQCGGI